MDGVSKMEIIILMLCAFAGMVFAYLVSKIKNKGDKGDKGEWMKKLIFFVAVSLILLEIYMHQSLKEAYELCAAQDRIILHLETGELCVERGIYS